MRKRPALTAALLCAVLAPQSAWSEDLAEFIASMTREHGFARTEVEAILADATKQQRILDAISRPAEGLPWWRYRNIFVKPDRAQGGLEFWRANAETLEKAEQRYGVPPEIVVAVIGVETFYGRHTGGHRVLDALYTLGFHYPKRASFFRRQLEEFLLLSREETIDPRQPTGSYAGAMGRPQFIPSSYRAYAVDFDGDGRRDIWENNADVIGSVGNYFAVHGWTAGAPVATRIEGVAARPDHFVAAGMKPSLTVGELRAAGYRLDDAVPDTAKTSVVALEQPDGEEYWAGLDNFYVITRYNHSNLYAMAVLQLSREILALHHADAKTADAGH
jgi:membrane-bound lytic murein transglycosylase B